ncbi:MAG: hypothetical protein D8M59_14220 [Planctomycetes bacterium]|nr:hypothetical protein [Planctomycetota bacterium]NOG55487.1 hypothetical protein [Planctomycetota bacterium]
MPRTILLGDEAVATAAIHSGVTGGYSYPGTPSTEILETFQKLGRRVPFHKVHAHWCANEKTAYEAAMGHSYAGHRSMVSFKHVGLNVAMDPYMSSAITGCNGGMVIAVADDPGMHSSQSEQDSRFLSHFALLPCLEPWDQQAAYDWTRAAFDLSEEFKLPVMVRLVTRLAHSRASVELQPPLETVPAVPPVGDWRGWTLLPANAKPNYERLLSKQERLSQRLEEGPYFQLDETGNRSYGIIATGLGVNYVKEAFDRYNVRHPLLCVGAYPVPDALLRKMFHMCDCILLVEEGMPLLERILHAAGLTTRELLRGRLTGDLPRSGELTPEIVATALGVKVPSEDVLAARTSDQPLPVVSRPPQLCAGCSHIDVFTTIDKITGGNNNARVFGDIGCYTLAALPPYDTMHTCVDMGASIPMAIGASQAGLSPAIAVIGDSTFTHSGMTGLADAINQHANVVVIISDNSTTAMTGGQPDIATGEDLVRIVKGLGIDEDHVHFIDANKAHHAEMEDALRREVEYEGPSVLVFRRPCIHNPRRDKAEAAELESAQKEVQQQRLQAANKQAAGELAAEAEAVPEGRPKIRDSFGPDFKRDLIMAGVGGQGILVIAHTVGITATRLGMYVKQAETHGMSQRGGAVISHVRYGVNPVHSDLVERGQGDILLAVEPMEALRWTGYLGPHGHLVASVKPVVNVPNYPELEEVLAHIQSFAAHTLLDADRLASQAGWAKSANMVLLGAVAPLLGFDDRDINLTLEEVWRPKGEKVITVNQRAYQYGRDAGLFYRALIEGGVAPADALVLASETEPSPDALHFVPAWAETLARDAGRSIVNAIHESNRPASVDPSQLAAIME